MNNFAKIFYYFIVLLLIFSISWDFTFAAEATNNSSSAGWFFTKEWFLAFLNWFLQIIGVFLALWSYLASLFLSPEWINWNLFWLTEKLRLIWILVSNVVYFVFAFILIWIAFMNIIWKNSDQYQLKQAIPKFIVWVLIVPFSWFLVQFILSLSAVLTVSSLSLPFDTFKTYWEDMLEIKVPQDCVLNLSEFKSVDGESSSESKWWELIKCEWKTNIFWWNSTQSVFWIISLYTYWILSFDSVDNMSSKFIEDTNTKTVWDIIVKVLFSVIFVIVYWILIITLTLVLMIRWIYIWIYIMMSPLFWLMFFFDKKDWWDWFFAKFNLKEFIALAMVPVYTMLALSFWLVFIYTVWKWLSTSTWISKEVNINDNKLSIWNSSLTIEWAYAWVKWDDITWFLDVVYKEWNWGLWVIWTLILQVFWIVVLRWTVMAAMRASTITKSITEPIYQFGTKVWEIASTAPWNMPVFGWQSMSSLSTAASTVWSEISSAQNRKWTDFAWKFIWWTENDKKYKNILANDPSSWQKAHKNTQDLNAIWDAKDISKSKAAIDAYIKNFEYLLKNDKYKDNDKVKNAIDRLRTSGLWNEQTIKEVFKIIDDNAKDPNNSLLNWNWDVSAWTVNDYLWKNSSSPSLNNWWNTKDNITLQKEEAWIKQFKVWNIWFVNYDWNKFTWKDDYKDLANYISKNIKSESEFNDLFREIWITNISDDIKNEIWKYFKDWKVDLNQDNWDKKDLEKYLKPKSE